MKRFDTKQLSALPDVIAPDGSAVRVLVQLPGGSMAHFELGSGQTAHAVAHRTVEELWYFVGGQGEMWRKLGEDEEVVAVGPGVAVSLPCGTHFQFRSLGAQPLAAVGVTMPPWPGEDEAYAVPGPWPATVGG